jgi:hypothetical protein
VGDVAEERGEGVLNTPLSSHFLIFTLNENIKIGCYIHLSQVGF